MFWRPKEKNVVILVIKGDIVYLGKDLMTTSNREDALGFASVASAILTANELRDAGLRASEVAIEL